MVHTIAVSSPTISLMVKVLGPSTLVITYQELISRLSYQMMIPKTPPRSLNWSGNLRLGSGDLRGRLIVMRIFDETQSILLIMSNKFYLCLTFVCS